VRIHFGNRLAVGAELPDRLRFAGDGVEDVVLLVLDLRGQIRGALQVAPVGRGHRQRQATPEQDDGGHDRRDNHDRQRLAARLVNAFEVEPEEVSDNGAGDAGCAPVHDEFFRPRVELDAAEITEQFQQQADDVFAGGDAADGPGEDVVEHQGGDGDFRHEAAERFADDTVDAAADEERAALDIDGADGVAEAHDGEDEPRGGGPDGLLDDAADVVGGGGEVAQDDRGGAPVRDER